MSISTNPKRKWTTEDKVRIVLESLNTNISVAELCRKYAINPNVFYRWKQRFIDGGKAALSNKPGNIQVTKEAETTRLKNLIGELTIANDSMKKVLEGEGKNGSWYHDEQGTEPQKGAQIFWLFFRELLLQAQKEG